MKCFTSLIFGNTSGILLLIGISLLSPLHAQVFDGSPYWVYQRGEQGYRLHLKKASQEGIRINDQQRVLMFRVSLSEQEYQDLIQAKPSFPLNIEWYRYNRAKLSLFKIEKLKLEDIKPYRYNGKRIYLISSSLQNILGGTWVLKISDSKGQYLSFEEKQEFDVIVF